MKKIRIGMVGMGFIADWHIKGFESVNEAEIVGMCRDLYGTELEKEAQLNKLQNRCKELDIKAYSSFDAMAEDDDIDALVIGSINPYHYDQIKKAYTLRKPIMVEKPVVTDLQQVEELIAMKEKNDLRLFPAHNFVYRNAVRKAKEILASGRLGQIIHSSFMVSHTIGEGHATGWRAKKDLATGGTLIDSGHHLIYQALFLLGKPQRMHGFTSKMVLKNMECEDTAQVSLQYADGSMAVVMQSWTADPKDDINGIRIFGTGGSMAITDALYVNGVKTDTDVGYDSSFANQAIAFTDYILNDTPPLSDLEDVKNTLQITYGTYKSNEQNEVIIF